VILFIHYRNCDNVSTSLYIVIQCLQYTAVISTSLSSSHPPPSHLEARSYWHTYSQSGG